MCRARFLQKVFFDENVSCELHELSAPYLTCIIVSWPNISFDGLPLPRQAYLWLAKPSFRKYNSFFSTGMSSTGVRQGGPVPSTTDIYVGL